MVDVEVIGSPGAATAALDPIRSMLLAELSEPISAASVASKLGIPRQKVNYHLRALEAHGLVRVAKKRKWGGITERLLVATAQSYIVSPTALGPVSTDPGRSADRLSAGYMISLAARVVQEVSALMSRSKQVEKRLATLTIDTEIRFRSAPERAKFTREVQAAIANLVNRYHHPSATDGRSHRIIILAHPLPHPHCTAGAEFDEEKGSAE